MMTMECLAYVGVKESFGQRVESLEWEWTDAALMVRAA